MSNVHFCQKVYVIFFLRVILIKQIETAKSCAHLCMQTSRYRERDLNTLSDTCTWGTDWIKGQNYSKTPVRLANMVKCHSNKVALSWTSIMLWMLTQQLAYIPPFCIMMGECDPSIFQSVRAVEIRKKASRGETQRGSALICEFPLILLTQGL